MKKVNSIIVFLLISIFLFGCQTKNTLTKAENTPTPTPQALKLEDYFPIKNNVQYYYEGKGMEYATYTVYNDYTTSSKVQQRVDNGGTVSAKVLEIKDGKLILNFTRGETYFRENFLESKSTNEDVLLAEPLEKGNKWTLKDSRVRTITGTSVDVSTPSGNYKAIEVTTDGPNDKTIDYYAKDVGLVKTVFTSNKMEITSSLSKIEENVSRTQKIKFYFPSAKDDNLYFKNQDVSFKTNDITRNVLENTYKSVVNSAGVKVLTPNTKINSLYLNTDNMVYLDLNSSFMTELNVGALYEELILQSIANTFGQYYGTDKVLLTIDNRLYQSGHIGFEKGQYLKVKTENTIEVK